MFATAKTAVADLYTYPLVLVYIVLIINISHKHERGVIIWRAQDAIYTRAIFHNVSNSLFKP